MVDPIDDFANRNSRMKVLVALDEVMALEPEEAPRLFRTDEERKNVIGQAKTQSWSLCAWWRC